MPTFDDVTQEVRTVPSVVRRNILDRKIDGRDVQSGTVPNGIVAQGSKTYDIIVSASGQGDYNNIEQAVAHVMNLGGGTIFVRSGTYTPSTAISITRPLTIVGEGSSLVTVNFNSTAGNFAITSSNIYSTGTISSIANGVNVTGSGTTWTSAMAGRYLFIATRWYLIATVTSATTLVLAEAYSDDVSLSAYRIATLTVGVRFSGMTIKSSTGTGISAVDCREFTTEDVVLISNNVGLSLSNVSQIILRDGGSAASTSDGVQLTNCGLVNASYFFSDGNGGNGITFSTVKIAGFQFCEANSNVDGYHLTSCDIIDLIVSCRSNSSNGIECVSGCNQINMSGCFIKGSTSDGIKLTASSNYCKIIGSHLDTNGGWGINIANANDNKTIVVGNTYNSNTSGTLTDSGTGTVNTGNST